MPAQLLNGFTLAVITRMADSKPTLFRPGPGKRGMTDLHYAAYCGDLDALLRSLEAGLAVNATDTYRGYTPTHWLADMAATGGPRFEMLRALVRHGADINIKTQDGTTALMLARGVDRLGSERNMTLTANPPLQPTGPAGMMVAGRELVRCRPGR